MDLVDALGARGVVSVVGAGGKKTAIYRLANAVDRGVVTATVRIPIFDQHVGRVFLTDTPIEAIQSASNEAFPIGVVPDREGEDRYRGYDPSVVDRLADLNDVEAVLVKADGARMRKFKAPSDHEPQIPPATRTVLVVVSAHVLGEALTGTRVHRVDRVRALTGLAEGDTITPDAVATVVASRDGGHKDVPPGASVVPVINMVDDAELEAKARATAAAIHARCRVDRVVLTRLTAADPIVGVVT